MSDQVSALKERISDEMKAAMRARDSKRLGVIRLVLADVKRLEVDSRQNLSDAEIVAVLQKMIKQRRDAIVQYEQGGRPELAEQEQFEITIIEEYLPQMMNEEEIDAAVAAEIQASGASSVKDMGKVMGALKAKLAGQADMSVVSARVKFHLAE